MPSRTARRRLSVSTALSNARVSSALHFRLDSSRGVFAPLTRSRYHPRGDCARPFAWYVTGPDRRRHAELADHPPREASRALEIVRRARREFSERDMFGCASAQQNRQPIHQLVFLKQIPVFGRLLHVAERREPARDDRHLVHRLGARRELGDDRVAGFVEGDDAPFFCIREAVLPLEADDDAIDCGVQLGHADFAFFAARGQQRRFVEHVFQIRADHPWRAARDVFEIDVSGELHFAGVHLEDGVAAGAVGPVDEDLPVEASRAQQRAVQNLGPVGRARTMMPSRESKPSISTSSWFSVCSRSSVPPPPCDPDRLLPMASSSSMKMIAGAFALACSNSLRTRDAPTPTKTSMNSDAARRKKRHAGFTRDRAREERLAGARRPDEQRPFRHARAERRKLRRAAQELDDLLELFFRLVHAGNVVEARMRPALLVARARRPARQRGHRLHRDSCACTTCRGR